MDDAAIPERVYIAAIHRADGPAGRAAEFQIRRRFDELPCCHRSWAQQGNCMFLHGYEREFDVEFSCAETEPNTGLVLDRSSLRDVRAALRHQFDHTTLIAADDPQRNLFEVLADRGAIDLRIMDDIGMERAADWVYDTAGRIVRLATAGRVWVSRVEARESRNNVVTLTEASVSRPPNTNATDVAG